MTVDIFSSHTLEQHTDALAAHLPSGRVFEAAVIDGSVMRLLLQGLSVAHMDLESMLVLFGRELDIANTTYLLDGWEKTVGIPDACFGIVGKTIEERRQQVLIKLASLGVQTAADFVALGAMFGVVVTVQQGDNNTQGWTGASGQENRNTIVIVYDTENGDAFFDGPPFPNPPNTQTVDGLPFHAAASVAPNAGFRFGSAGIATMECLFEQLRPANNQIVYFRG